MLNVDTKRKIDTARDILVGKVPDPKSQVEQITIALIYKFMDDMDKESEELGGKAKFFTGEYKKYAWSKIFDPRISGFELVNVYGEAIQRMNQNPNIPQLFRDIFKNAYLPYRDPETLKSFLKSVNDFQYDHSERLGDAFEYLLSVLGSQGGAGQFRTPRHIIDFMVEIIDPKKNESILDPACGTAGFLISSYKHILKHNSKNFDLKKDPKAFELHGVKLEEITINSKKYRGDKLNSDEKERLATNILGYDISPDMVRLSLVNMYLHGFSNPKIFEYDTLTSEARWNEYADVIMANPPFMSPKGGIRPHKRFSIESKRSEVLFVDYIAEHLTPRGRSAIIVPEGIIFQRQTAYKNLRKMLIEKNYLVGVISLPAGVFNPYSGVKTSILWLDRSLAKKTNKILFVKIGSDGFDLGAQRRPIKENDLPEAFRAIHEYKKSLEMGRVFIADKWKNVLLVKRQKIAGGGDYNLSGDRYKNDIRQTSKKWPIVELGEVVLDMKDGGTPSRKKQEYFGGNINWCVVRDIKPEIWDTAEKLTEAGLKNSSAKVWPIDSIIISLGASIGNVGIAKVPTATKQGLSGIVVDKSKILPKFLAYILVFQKERIQSFASGVTIKEIRPSRLKKLLTFPLPPLSIQEEIVAEIETYQKVIDGARQVVENYKPHIAINPDWEMVELVELIEFISGLTLSIPECEDKNGIPILAINNVTENGEITLNGLRKIRLPKKKTINFVRKGDLLFNWRNGSKRLVGKTAYFDLDGEYVFASFLIGIRTKQERLVSKYLWYVLNAYRKDGKYMQFMRQNVNGLFNREELKILKIPLPSLNEQENIVTHFENERKLIEADKKLIAIFEQKIKDRIAKV